MPSARTLASPASLKGVLSAREAAAALAQGLRQWSRVDELPVADGGEGTLDVLQPVLGADWREADVHDAFGRPRTARWLWRGGDAYVEAAEVIPLDPQRLDPLAASSRGLGELIRAVGATRRLFVGLGGTANVDGGAGLLDVLGELPAPTQVGCDVDVLLADAVRLFAAQKGATPEQLPLLERRLEPLAEYADLPGAGAAGGLGAAFASLGAELVPGAALVLDHLGFDPARYDLVVTGEGTVDATSARGKAPGEVAVRCTAAGVRCVVFGGRVREPLPGVETVALSGDPGRAREDLRELGLRLRGLDAAR
jgi:glycerate kinase